MCATIYYQGITNMCTTNMGSKNVFKILSKATNTNTRSKERDYEMVVIKLAAKMLPRFFEMTKALSRANESHTTRVSPRACSHCLARTVPTLFDSLPKVKKCARCIQEVTETQPTASKMRPKSFQEVPKCTSCFNNSVSSHSKSKPYFGIPLILLA